MAEEGDRGVPSHALHRLRGCRRHTTCWAWPSAIRPGDSPRLDPTRAEEAAADPSRADRSWPWSRSPTARPARRAEDQRLRARPRGRPVHEGPAAAVSIAARTAARSGRRRSDRSGSTRPTPSPGRHRPGPGGHPQGASRAAQAGRDRRGPGLRDRPQERPRRQHERPVDRDSLATSPRGPGIDRLLARGRGRGNDNHAVPTTSTPFTAQESGE